MKHVEEFTTELNGRAFAYGKTSNDGYIRRVQSGAFDDALARISERIRISSGVDDRPGAVKNALCKGFMALRATSEYEKGDPLLVIVCLLLTESIPPGQIRFVQNVIRSHPQTAFPWSWIRSTAFAFQTLLASEPGVQAAAASIPANWENGSHN